MFLANNVRFPVPMLKNVVSYIANLDLEDVSDPKMLQKPFDEMSGHEKHVIHNKESCKKLEVLLTKCSFAQLVAFYQRIAVAELAMTKMGSQIVERIYRNLFRHIYTCGEKKKRSREVLRAVVGDIEPHFEKLFFDPCGTFVLRPYFELLAGKYTGYENREDAGSEKRHKIAVSKVKEYKRHAEFYTKMRAYAVFLRSNVAKIFGSSFTSATFSVYLKCRKDKTLIKTCIDTYFCASNLQNPIFSYFFEELVGFASKKRVAAMFDKISAKFVDLSTEDYSNYVARAFAARHDPKAVYAHITESLDAYSKNSNVILALAMSLYNANEHELFLRLLQEFYSSDDMFEKIALGNGKVAHKFVGLACCVMSLKPNAVVKKFNADFLKLFDNEWLYEKAGRELCTGFLTGSAPPGERRRFITGLRKEYHKLVKNHYGKQLLVTMSRNADYDTRLKLISILKANTA